MANLSDINLDIPVSYLTHPTEINIRDIIADFCIQIDQKLLLAAMLVFSGYFLTKIILPRAKLGLENVQILAYFKGIWTPGIDFLISLGETFMLGGACLFWMVAYYQGLITGFYKLWSGFLILILIIVGVAEGVGFIRRKMEK